MNGVSIIITLYNKESSIASTVENALGQSCADFELIVIDDGSTDDSVARLAPFKDRIRLVSQANAGPSAARNAGARAAKYDVFSFLDADDELHADFVRLHMQARRANPEADLSINSFDVLRENALERREQLFERFEHFERFGHAAGEQASGERSLTLREFEASFVVNVHSAGYCINRSLFEKTGGFDEELRCWEITDALTRFSLSARLVTILRDVLSFKNEGGTNSQFERLRDNLDQRRAFCERIITYLPQLPDTSRAPYFQELEALCMKLWRAVAIGELVRMFRRIQSLPGADRHFRLPGKVLTTIRLAGPFVSKTRSTRA